LQSTTVENLISGVLTASAAVECLGGKELGSTSRNRKVKSLLSRWIEYGPTTSSSNETSTVDGNSGDDASTSSNGIYIERHTVVTSNISCGKNKIPKDYIVLGLYDKYYNKWFMTGDRKKWGPLVSDTEKKKFKVAIRMVEDGVLEKYDYVCPNNDIGTSRKEVFQIVDGTAIMNVKGKFTY